MIEHVLHEWAAKPLRFGVSDCCQFAGAVVNEFRGHNPMSRFSYMGSREAQELIRSFGSLENAVTDTLGAPIPVELASDGDVLLADMSNGESIVGAVCFGRFVVRTEDGITDWPLAAARLAWGT